MKSTSICHLSVTICVLAFATPAAAQVKSENGMVAADEAHASKNGASMLEQGGNAVDAGVATLLTLGLVNPFASGLGGGGFCVYRPSSGRAVVLDFRETAPAAASRDMYVVDGKVERKLSTVGGLAVATPGEPLGLFELHKKYGTLPWKDVVEPTRKMASDGYTVGELLPKRLESKSDEIASNPALMALFVKNGKFVAKGDRRKNPALAAFLTEFAKNGPTSFYEGAHAKQMVDAVAAAGGILSLEDLKNYRPTWREPLEGTYRGLHVITMPPPSSGGITLLETLNILERYDLPRFGYGVELDTVMIEALKHAFADRARWLGDADFVDIPWQRLTSKPYAETLQKRIRPWTVGPLESYGTAAPPVDDHGTSHMSVIDKQGNMLACTSTVNTSFGSQVAVPALGIVMNNQMDDFSSQPGVPNAYGLIGNEQNAIAPGKRPLSSMSPTLILKDGKPFMAVGASGGPTIITGTLQAIIRVVDFGMSPVEAVTLPRLHAQWMPDLVFMEQVDATTQAILEKRGHRIKPGKGFTAVQVVVVRDGVYEGASDPRKYGKPAAPAR